MPIHAEITRNAHRRPTPLHVKIARAMHALMGVTNIEFSRVIRHYAMLVLHRESEIYIATVKYAWYTSVDLIHHTSRGGSGKWCAMGMPIACT